MKYEYLRSLQLCEDQGIRGKLKKRVREHVLAIRRTYMETRHKMFVTVKRGKNHLQDLVPSIIALAEINA